MGLVKITADNVKKIDIIIHGFKIRFEKSSF
jgi:hypothetical protein